MAISLSSQNLVHCPPGDKIRLSLLSTATIDALGAPVEFHKPRGSFPPVTTMLENKNFKKFGTLPPGTWTDDTSMALCLAHSLTTSGSPEIVGDDAKGGFDLDHQLRMYLSWFKEGFLSCTGICFDWGKSIEKALKTYDASKDKSKALEKIDAELSKYKKRQGNGSLMRVVPIGLAYWSLGEDKAAELANLSSGTTHPDGLCREACEIYTRMITWMMSHASAAQRFSKLDLLQRLSHLPIRNQLLRDFLSIPPPPPDCSAVEEYYVQTHPLLKLATQYPPLFHSETGIPTIPPADEELGVPSSGYVVDTFKAALYAFFATETFEMGALLVVNMGDDADTVGAVYAGLAATWYASNEDSQFWSENMRNWTGDLRGKELVEKISNQLVKYEEKVRSKKAVDV